MRMREGRTVVRGWSGAGVEWCGGGVVRGAGWGRVGVGGVSGGGVEWVLVEWVLVGGGGAG